MKKILFGLIILCTTIQATLAQKVKIKKHRFYVEYAQLPKHYVEPDMRTYTVNVSGNATYNVDGINDEIAIRGWERNDDEAYANADIKIGNFTRGQSSVSSREEVKKDKDGNVTSRTKYYKYTSTNGGDAVLRIYGPTNEYIAPKKKKKPKKEKKPAKKKKPSKKELEKAANPFLQNVDDIDTGDEEAADEEQDIAGLINLSQSYTYKGKESTSKSAAYKSYLNGEAAAYQNHRSTFENKLASRASNALNGFYGFKRARDYVVFRKLNSKKHPEYEMFRNGTEALKAIFGKKRFNVKSDEIAEQLQPVLDYFMSVADKYSKDDKHEKRLKSAALYNVGLAYYYLDMPDKVQEIGTEYTRWGHDEKYG